MNVWKPALGLEGLYEVSDDGRVRNAVTKRVRKLCPDRKGYLRTRIAGRTYRMHTLVLEAFVGPRPEGLMGRHLDDVKANNALSNLEWGTESDNALDRVRNGLHNMARKTHCPRNHPYDEKNTFRRRGRRECRTCIRERTRVQRAKVAA